jgi:D-3-phosphoglycerate dehydrogenase
MRILAHDPYVSVKRAGQTGAELCDLRRLLSESDFVSIHAAKTSETSGMIREQEIMLMKEGARLISCARGGLVDEEALYRALTSGHLAGAALDVFAEEPARQNPLFELPNVVVTPHLSGSTLEAQELNGTVVAEQVLRVLRGEMVPEAVNLPALPPEQVRAAKAYLPLAEALGRFLAQAFPVRPEKARVELAGQVADAASVLLTNTALKGLLQGMLEEEVNFINAPIIAAQRGLTVTETRSSTPRGYLSLLSLAVEGVDGAATISGTLGADGSIRFVEVGGFPVDFVPSRYQIVTRHQDKPGMIGQVGTLLGAKRVNIAGMQVGRRSLGGEAVMILQVDDPVDDETLGQIGAVDGILQVRQVFLP